MAMTERWDEMFARCSKSQLDTLISNDGRRVIVHGLPAVLCSHSWQEVGGTTKEQYVVKVDSRLADSHEAASIECQRVVDVLNWKTLR